ncbi:MAG: hypothetical protein COV55_00935 [Candidatus Komeilibacteria bacterium CG11_big_fil_rev_8_21_14_0_20_36_20]|uniref:Uncharacterized protein n=1 Tax=Candidatus Komeilibacteria bacterium CG11_big_fil_rev_8_21_14_0_20_36_20 TaxID=1974477 RepID=A0A2H0NDN5_9BACT|nr:MAG: hypothetical protein COV55_00935 [Candidatus Komeilibacteria bacterium CG11_big_fil_rev_8_21_14_0_20_36_20]PIR81345.1 MAG: hypothetical protein COU21_03905 [Candidatus Komeilibacteria bacterium CG10_big_fil_rev_8_21_14_0_10_36_65]PJC54975.1 MAG: hypothetical protein CO027_04575 [Candidatus Komeilibacteria bacterium CG_4_9_14_0_2_um_filter_36_13]
MARIAFLQHILLENLGVMAISSVLKEHGHVVDVFCLEEEDSFYESVMNFKPDIVACSLCIGEQEDVLAILREIKKINKDILTLIGGAFTLVFPEIVNEDCIDLMCVGDGELACLEILNRLDKKENFFNIPGIWFKKNGQVEKNTAIAYVNNIEHLPSFDRDIYFKKYEKLRKLETKPFILSRGCPFRCSYCYTNWINQFYRDGGGTHFRLYSPQKLIAELLYVKDKYGLKWARFQDATFNVKLEQVREFLKLYIEKKLPGFIIYARVEDISEEYIALLKKAGCDKLVIGIQTGNETLRKELLNRNMSNKQIIAACQLLKKYQIRIGADIIFGWPGETMDNAYETINLCRQLDLDDINSNVLVPYPKTQIGNYCLDNNYLKDIITYKNAGSTADSNNSLIKQDNIRQLINLDKLCYLLIRFPNLKWLVNLLIKLPPNRIFLIIKDVPSIRRNLKYEVKNTKDSFIYIMHYLKLVMKR